MPSDQKSNRRLSAILFADIVGYTAMMQSDEGSTMNRLRHYQTILKKEVADHNGEIIKNYGDGSLCLFNSVLDAVHCARALQITFQKEPKVPLRIGLHSGDVMFEEGDIYGNDINIASRIESSGIAGSILMSKNIYDKVKNQSDLSFQTLGTYNFKNVEEPISVWALANQGLNVPKGTTSIHKLKSVADAAFSKWFIAFVILMGFYLIYSYEGPNDPIKKSANTTAISDIPTKSIAVLPLVNMSGQSNLEYVCDGMTNAIISKLTNISDFDKVVPRTSAFKYKNLNKSIPEIALELGVSNILQGSFQKAGQQIKIDLQLIDGNSDKQLWSHEYSGTWEPNDIFSIQSTITETVAGLMNSEITESEFASLQKMPTKNTEAYDLFLKAEYQRNISDSTSFSIAIPLYEKALELDSSFVEAYLGLSEIWDTGGLVWGIYDQNNAWTISKNNLKKAYKIDSTLFSMDHELFGGSFYYDWNFDYTENVFLKRTKENNFNYEDRVYEDYTIKTGRYSKALELSEQLIKNNENYGLAHFSKAEALFYLGQTDQAIKILKESDPKFSDSQFYLRESTKYYFYLKEYDKFESQLDRMMQNFSHRAPIHLWFNVIRYQLNGDIENVNLYLDKIRSKYESNSSGSPAWFMALYYFYINDQDNGFLWLQRSFDRHEVEMTWLRSEPLLQAYKEDSRYRDIYQKMKWPM
ncbi:MAG: adenylate/guanylate cyclase domain-containing protein [Bacteroidia bacterium]|nr:adenylate/guanylate cyclase domain-containing protein [Bacteroidia bacterium]